MAAKIAGWTAYVAVVAALIFVGWNQPLRYRFMSQAAISAIEQGALSEAQRAAKQATPPPQRSGALIDDPTWKTKLDGAPRDIPSDTPPARATPGPGPAR